MTASSVACPAEESPTLSIVIPVFNELAVLPICLSRVNKVLDQQALTAELIFVDDGSNDGSGLYLEQRARDKGTRLRLLRLSRNYGKEAAMTAGLDHACGDAVIILDADLQDPPELIPKMMEQWQAGADVVIMRRRSRAGDPWLKRTAARSYYRLLNQLSVYEIPPDTGDFRLLSRRAVNALRRLPERNRYMKGLFAWIGMPTATLLYDREARVAGSTKWNYFRLIRLGIEGITSFSTRPLRLATGLGLLTAIFGTVFGSWIVFKAVAFGDPVRGYPSLMAMVTFLGGIQLITVGILGEYVGKTYIEAKQRPIYVLRDIVGESAELPTRARECSRHGTHLSPLHDTTETARRSTNSGDALN